MPSRYDLRSASLPAYRTFGQRADEVAGLLGNLGRGAGYTALDLLGTASDLGLTVTDLLGVTDPAVPRAQMIGTGDWLIDRAADLGLVQPRTGEGAETAGRFLGQVAIPGVSPAEMAGWAKVLPFLLGTFKGMNANLSDDETRMLQKAFELEQQGLGREAIRQATNPPGGSGGWARAPWDQKWRIEMDDSQARMTDEAIGLWGAQNLKEGRTAQQVFKHPALYQAYPALADVPVSSTMPRGLGTASWLGMKQGVQLDPDFLARFSARNPGEISRAMLHELGGHGVQSLEGFTPGSSALLAPDNARQVFGPTMEKLNDMLVQGGAKSDSLPMWDDIPMNGMSPYTVPDLYQKFELTRFLKNDELPAYEKLLGELEAAAPKYRGPNENYLLAGGEAESRLIEARRKLTPAQRAALDPYEQMDTMLKQEGFPGGISELRGGLLDEGPAMSRKMTRKLADEITGKDPRLDDIRAAMRELDAREQALWDRFPAPNPGSQGLLSGSRLDAIEAQERARQAVMGSADYADIQSSRNALSKRMAKERKKIADEIYQQSKSQPIIAPWLLLGGTGALGAGLLGGQGYD